MEVEARLSDIKIPKLQTKEKVGNIRVCPACGAEVGALDGICPECGHEFNSVKTVSSYAKLAAELDAVEATRKDNGSIVGSIVSFYSKGFGLSNKVDARKQEIIRNFPIPNSKEDLMEFWPWDPRMQKKREVGIKRPTPR